MKETFKKVNIKIIITSSSTNYRYLNVTQTYIYVLNTHILTTYTMWNYISFPLVLLLCVSDSTSCKEVLAS